MITTKRLPSKAVIPVSPTRTTEVRHGRNFIREGDVIRYHDRPGRAWRQAKFLSADTDSDGVFYDVLDLSTNNRRFLRPEKVQRIGTIRGKRGE